MTARRAAAPQKPWYLVIGPPGAGKSSMLANSGFSFQNAPTIPREIVTATGDLIRYWEADDAIFLECAGGLLGATASSADEAAWEALLRRLKRHRPQRPLNGAILVSPLDALAKAAASEPEAGSEFEATMRRARKRIAQADAVLGARLPIYIVITKADLLPGFASSFGALRQTEREQVWGVTLPLDDGAWPPPGAAERLAQGIDDLPGNLARGLLARLHDEDDPRRAAEIFAFPNEFGSLAERLRALARTLGGESRLQPALRLRGLYLTAAEHGFFVKRLFSDVVLVEEAVVTIDPQDTPSRRRLRQIAACIALVAAFATSAWFVFAFSDQSKYLAATRAHLEDYVGVARDLPAQDVADANLEQANGAVDRLSQTEAAAVRLGALSLDRSAQVGAAQRELDGRALNGLLLPRILVALQQDMRAPANASADAKVYLMLGGLTPLDRDFAGRTLAALYERIAPPGAKVSLRARTTALLAAPFSQIALDPIAAEDARALASP